MMESANPRINPKSPTGEEVDTVPSASTRGLLGPLALALPSEEQTWLLQACLMAGDEGTRAWRSWQRRIGDPIALLRLDNEGVKGLLPLLFTARGNSDVMMDGLLKTTIKTAYLNEEVRFRSYDRICHLVLSVFSKADVEVVVFKGADLAYTVYDLPILRHTDGLDLMIKDGYLQSAADLLGAMGCKLSATPAERHWRTVKARHKSGLTITLHRSPFDLPFPVPVDELWMRSELGSIAHAPARLLSPADSLLVICVGLYLGEIHAPLRWACDGAYIVRRRPDLDWRVLVDFSRSNQMALPLVLTLGYLAQHLNAPIPGRVIELLAHSAGETRVEAREAFLSGARRSRRGGFRRMLRAAPDWRTRLSVIRWILFPTPSYLRWTRGIHAAQLPLHYLLRPFKYIARRKRIGPRHGRR
ncbi:MAG TPA: nucleotidyltransferase family protein [Rhodothermales bacterium]|nr:nucleotidyltransferase family protein [Rhodothermales bacterium]